MFRKVGVYNFTRIAIEAKKAWVCYTKWSENTEGGKTKWTKLGSLGWTDQVVFGFNSCNFFPGKSVLWIQLFCIDYHFIVKNPFGLISDALLQLSVLTPVNNSQLLLKLLILDNFRLVWRQHKEATTSHQNWLTLV